MLRMLRIFIPFGILFMYSSQVSSEYSELMNQEIGVRVEVQNLVYHNLSTVTATGHPRCRLTLHKSGWDRDTCSSPQFKPNDTLSWSTRVCYKWVCDTTKYAMRVESCWIGTPKMPVFIVRDDGCTIEKAILTSPVYTSFNRAAAIGWMAVRQKNMKFMHVGCTIRLCHLCDPACQEITPPRTCNDSRADDYDAMWNSSSRVKNLCFPSPSTTESSEGILNVSMFNFRFIFITLILVVTLWHFTMWTGTLHAMLAGTMLQLFGRDMLKFYQMTPNELSDSFSIQKLVTQPHRVNMDLLTFIAWILILGVIYILTLLALKFTTIRVVLVTLAFLPFAFMLAFFIFRHPQLTNEAHKTAFFATWKVGGHRGSSHGDIPENSLEAFSAVKSEGGQLAEMDIQITKDGVPVICHDSNTVRVTGVDKDISSMTLAEFRELRFLGTNTSLPTFAEAVAHCVANDIMMIWDVKNVDEALLTQFVTQIRMNNLYAKVLVSGFNPIDMYMVKMADPKILTGFTWRMWELSTTDEDAKVPRFSGALHAIANVLDVLAYGLARGLIMPKFLGSDVVFYHVNDVSRYLKSDAAANNIYVAGWTSNNAAEQVWLRDYLNVPFLTDNVSTVPKQARNAKKA